MDNYIKILEKFLDMIDWKLLQDSTFKLGTDEKVSVLTTKDHLSLMISIRGIKRTSCCYYFKPWSKRNFTCCKLRHPIKP